MARRKRGENRITRSAARPLPLRLWIAGVEYTSESALGQQRIIDETYFKTMWGEDENPTPDTLMLAWIDSHDLAHASAALIHIGRASSMGLPIYVASPRSDEAFLVAARYAEAALPDAPTELEAMLFFLRPELHFMPYADFLTSGYWRYRRQSALDAADRACQLCNSRNKTLHVHHRTYERRGFELPSDLIVLCEDCHGRFHDKLPKE